MINHTLRKVLAAAVLAVGISGGVATIGPLSTAGASTAITVQANTSNAGAAVTVWRWTGSGWAYANSGRTDAKGRFYLPVPAGYYYEWTTSKTLYRYPGSICYLNTFSSYAYANPAAASLTIPFSYVDTNCY